MSIRAVTYRADGTRNTHEKACFGFLANAGSSSGGSSNGPATGYTQVGFMPIRDNCVNGEWGQMTGDGHAYKRYMDEIENILATVPMYREFSVTRTRRNDIQQEFEGFEIKAPTSLPADQIILGMFFLRNITNYQHYAHAYTYLRTNTELSIPACLLVCHMFSRKKTMSSFDNQNTRWARQPTQCEPSPIHFETFGKFSFCAFANQTEAYRPWKQEPMAQRGGYKRDSHYNSAGAQVTTNLSSNMQGIVSPRRVREYMASALTITEVEAPIHENMVSNWTGSDADLLARISEILDEEIGVSDSLREQIRWASLTDEERAAELLTNPTDPATGRLREGVRVRLTSAGRQEYVNTPFNPHDQVGYITTSRDPDQFGYTYSVRWGTSNMVNDYREDDIEVAAA